MRILFVSSEIYPFAKTGGLADVSGSLPKALTELGINVKTVMPLYKSVNVERFGIEPAGKKVTVSLKSGKFEFEVFRVSDGVEHYFLKNEQLFHREFLYGTPQGDYPDNDVRFGAFCWAVVKLIEEGFFRQEIVHVNDWQTALIPVLLKKRKSKVKTLLTIHNLAYQGIFPKETVEKLNLGWELFNLESLEFWGKVNFLKGGIVFSDAINTVSPTYSKEITTPEFGFGLDGVLRKYSYKLFGILNGIDYEVWNPETDRNVYVNYTETSIGNKDVNKSYFLKETNLWNEELPLFAFIGRLAKQKGIDLIVEGIEEMSKLPANFAFLGTGDAYYNRFFNSIKGKYRNVYVKVAYDEPLSRKMYASADFLIMPSLYEPCGLNQMIAMRYGTLVVGRETGGIADTVRDVEEPGGYGFLFREFKTKSFLEAVKRAISFFDVRKDRVLRLKQFVMGIDFSWNASALKYMRLYENLIEGRMK